MAELRSEAKDAEVKFKEDYIKLLAKADRLGIDLKDLVYKKGSRNKLKGEKKSKKCLSILSVVAIFLIVAICIIFINNQLVLDSISGYFGNERCIIPVFSSLFLPPVDCSMCKNVKSIEKINSISQDGFENLYAYSGVPVIITDATINWTATEKFSYNFFADLYLKSDFKLENESNICQFFPYDTNFKNLSHFLSQDLGSSENAVPWYVGWGSCDSDVSDELRKHYSKPYFLPEHSESSRIDWIFMGQPGFGAPVHLDKVGNPSWQAQIKGSKLWTLEPPYECYFECERSIQVVVNAGEIIVLDTNVWYHGTEIVGDEISITIGSEYD